MKIDILVPQYKEGDEIVGGLLDSIENQKGIDFRDIRVIICNDGSGVYLSEELFSRYSYEIEYHKEEHCGVSGTRNKCLGYSNADYVMFCDADDGFYGEEEFSKVISKIGNNDVIIGSFKQYGKDFEHIHNNNIVHVHGKIFRREYLLENDIRFDERLDINEDFTFCLLSINCSEKVIYLDDVYYRWNYRPNSVTNSIENFFVTNYINLLKSKESLIDELIKRDMKGQYMMSVCCMVYEVYFIFNSNRWLEYSDKAKTERYFCGMLYKYRNIWNSVSMKDKGDYLEYMKYDIVKENNLSQGEMMSMLKNKPFKDWLKKIQKKYK